MQHLVLFTFWQKLYMLQCFEIVKGAKFFLDD